MMTTSLDKNQAEALANLIHHLRPEWDIAGIKAALYQAKDRGSAHEVTHAALYAAENLTNRTPAIISHAGPHWTRGRELGDGAVTLARCAVEGHEHEQAHNCRICAADAKARDDAELTVHQEPPDADRIDMYAIGARNARRALAQAKGVVP